MKIFEKWLRALGKLEYVQGNAKPNVDCILCAIRDNDERVKSLKVYEDEIIFVVLNLYPYNIGHLMAETPNFLAAGVFYLLNIFGIMIFALLPALKEGNPKTALVYGALYGLFTYATYDLTNFATLRDWPLKVVFVDILWGTFLTAIVALVAYHIGANFK